MSFSDIEAIVDNSAKQRPKRKAPKPLRTSDGTVLQDEPVYRLPNTGRPAVLDNGRKDNPLDGKKCAVRRCREGVQYTIRQPITDLPEDVPPQDYVPSDNPLVIQLEMAVNSVRPAVMVPIGEPVYLCIGHYSEFMAARNARVVQERESRQTPSWPLHELNYEGATVEVHDSTWFTLTDGDGKTMKLDVRMHMDEVKARMAGKTYETQVLSPAERENFKRLVQVEEFAKDLAPKAIANAHGANKPWMPEVNYIKD